MSRVDFLVFIYLYVSFFSFFPAYVLSSMIALRLILSDVLS
jgi:hypothetical protein